MMRTAITGSWRTDDIIKSSGYRIGPFEVEAPPGTPGSWSARSPVPDELRGQVVKATLVLAAGYEPSDDLAKELQEHVKKVTAPTSTPIINLPRNSQTISGKIRRVEIRERITSSN